MSRWRIVSNIAKVWMLILLCSSVAYAITFGLFGFIPQPGDFIRYILSETLAFLIFGLTVFLIGRTKNSKRSDVLNTMTDALRQIAKGNFRVKLNAQKLTEQNHPFGKIFDSINHMAEELNRMEQMRQEFISNVSHEIQSPLTSIRGFANALQNDQLSPEARWRYLKIIEKESTRLSKLSENLLKLTSLESANHPFDPKPYRLDKQLRQVILSLEPQWEEKSMEMDISLDELRIVADEDLMNQLWVNLISNSIKFTPEGGCIKIQLRQKGKFAEVILADTGIGIAEEDQAHIFDRFYKADKSRNRSVGGSGLGLAIVKKIIDMHGGKIEVESRLGEGTKMIVTIPCGYEI
ncbi:MULTISPECIES: cell wall metabolism sensor histidine kinase WalK [Thermoactinomyces]|jgi:two-component system, OmpR family, phosphate regulon sensor histidine kinase PhoR|uniref:histidine kinase n=1 Tax=Thermoactinomyces daqus TaxID=1329516 RepID=A0A7W1XCV0_9BACL|nr:MULTISPECIES: HAMP domain-containing sensor histidine kinase [Thermoactinomyces]MBA4544325.1 two-component sensor histidine kinase [Thermoactinomyces daqus]MBH8599411.1 two-component sensor histidine kinase [Thermoactinomyces sp. CICC 10523]MBH8608268.1 two-component sensor histidine kinase [Thermoactinomyces sp. CICC 10521]